MSKRSRRGGQGPAPAPPPSTGGASASGLAGRAVLAALLAALAASALAVDTMAEAAFDSPKRLVVLVSVAIASVLAFGPPGVGLAARWRGWRPWARAAAVLAASVLVLALVSASTSPRRAVSLDSLRTFALYGLLVPLGASSALEAPGRSRLLLTVFLGGCAVNAAVALSQISGTWSPVDVVGRVGRGVRAGALVGNEGVLGLLLAFGTVAVLGIALERGRRAGVALGTVVLLVVALVCLQSFTSFVVLLAGVAVLVVTRYGRHALIPAGVLFLVLGAGFLTYQGMAKKRIDDLVRDLVFGQWDQVSSFRDGPWLAAVEMVRERPLRGLGPGTYGADFIEYRVRAELRHSRRLSNPFLSGSYAEAHSDLLQGAAELGVPAALAGAGALLCLLYGLARAARSGSEERSLEAVILLAVLAAGALSALTWFPLQTPATSVPLLLAAGRGFRISS